MKTSEYAKFGSAIDNCKTKADATALRASIMKKPDDQDRKDLLSSLATHASGLSTAKATSKKKKA